MINLEQSLRGSALRIVFTEGCDQRMLQAAVMLSQKHLLIPVLYGNRGNITQVAGQLNVSLDGIEILDPYEFQHYEQMIIRILALRKGKTDRATAEEWVKKDSYFCTMYVELGYGDGLLGGSTNSTADTLRPVMHLIKTSPGNTLVSSCFLMIKEDHYLFFSDCSLNISPTTDELVEITLQSANTARSFGIEPNVALLSYSTDGSGHGNDVERVRAAVVRLKRMPLDYPVDGEMQVDCALSNRVAALKYPTSDVAGHANVMIFPDLNAGNIGYKLVANLGGYEALGPILQGVRLPMNDLSRSATTDEIYKMALITAIQKQSMLPSYSDDYTI